MQISKKAKMPPTVVGPTVQVLDWRAMTSSAKCQAQQDHFSYLMDMQGVRPDALPIVPFEEAADGPL